MAESILRRVRREGFDEGYRCAQSAYGDHDEAEYARGRADSYWDHPSRVRWALIGIVVGGLVEQFALPIWSTVAAWFS